MKVLVAEDDPHILEGLLQLLRKEGYTANGEPNGKKALAAFEAHEPDFLILDIMMPEVNGYDVCREIRKRNEKIPILFLSAKSEEVDKVIGLELGADDFMSKPFGASELMARVRALSRRALAERKETVEMDSFQMGDLLVLPGELRANRDDTVIDLGPRDMKILQLLFEKKGQIINRNLLADRCWGTDYVGSTRTMDQHIAQLRKKIELDPKEPRIIQTIHGAGYRYD